MLDMSMYRFYPIKNGVIAVSTYAGKTVRGVAKCNPADEFDIEKGKLLAAARCNAKVARKRYARAIKKYNEAYDEFTCANEKLNKMIHYKDDSVEALQNADKIIEDILKTL